MGLKTWLLLGLSRPFWLEFFLFVYVVGVVYVFGLFMFLGVVYVVGGCFVLGLFMFWGVVYVLGGCEANFVLKLPARFAVLQITGTRA